MWGKFAFGLGIAMVYVIKLVNTKPQTTHLTEINEIINILPKEHGLLKDKDEDEKEDEETIEHLEYTIYYNFEDILRKMRKEKLEELKNKVIETLDYKYRFKINTDNETEYILK
jgi:hypothetical protein